MGACQGKVVNFLNMTDACSCAIWAVILAELSPETLTPKKDLRPDGQFELLAKPGV